MKHTRINSQCKLWINEGSCSFQYGSAKTDYVKWHQRWTQFSSFKHPNQSVTAALNVRSNNLSFFYYKLNEFKTNLNAKMIKG